MKLRSCLAEPIDDIFWAAELLAKAVDADLADRPVEAACHLAAANMQSIWNYTNSVWGKGSKETFGLSYALDGPPQLPREAQPRPRMPSKLIQQAAIERDGYHCRFCGIPVIGTNVRKWLHRAYPEQVPWGSSTNEQHAAFQCMWLQFDHILPNSRGGASTLENIVITCAPCNFGRMEFTLSEAGLIDPLSRPTPNRWNGFATWDGLERALHR